MPYVELHACSAFSFLRGASFPEQLAETAAGLEMPAMALLDRNGVYGAQRFSVAAREQNVRPIVGAELSMEDGGVLPVLVKDRTGYANLCALLTQAHLRSEKGGCAIQWNELPEFAEGLIALFSDLGSARVSRAGFGVSPKQSFKSSRRRDAVANTRDACATQKSMKRVFLTGASSGIGLATAKLLTEHGDEVWGTSRDIARLPQLPHLHPVRLDLSDLQSLGQSFDAALKDAGHFDVVVNNAGSGHFSPGEFLTVDAVRQQFQTVVFAHIELCRDICRRNRLVHSAAALQVAHGRADSETRFRQFKGGQQAEAAGSASNQRNLFRHGNGVAQEHKSCSRNFVVCSIRNPMRETRKGC